MEDILQRYFNMENRGAGIYFDADEIVELLDHFEEMDDLEHYKKVVKLGQKIHPHSIDIQIRTCKVHIFNEEFEKALALIEHIGEPDNLELNLLRYECLCALDRYNEVVAHLEAQQNLTVEELQDTYEFLAALLNEQYSSEQAYDLICRGMALFPDSTMLKEELCFYYETQDNLQQALEIARDLVVINPYNPDYWYLQGRIYTLMEAYNKAIESFDFALICDDTDLEIKILKAYCHYMNETYEKIIEVYMDVFAEETANIVEYIRPLMETSDYAECASILLRKMLEEFDNYQSFPKVIAESIEKLFFAGEKRRQHEATYLHSSEINRDDLEDISSNELSANYLNNKNHYN